MKELDTIFKSEKDTQEVTETMLHQLKNLVDKIKKTEMNKQLNQEEKFLNLQAEVANIMNIVKEGSEPDKNKNILNISYDSDTFFKATTAPLKLQNSMRTKESPKMINNHQLFVRKQTTEPDKS